MNEANTPTTEAQYDAYSAALWRRLPENRREMPTFLDALPQRDRHAIVLEGLDARVSNGGFQKWEGNVDVAEYHETLLLALTLLKAGVQGEDAAVVAVVEELVGLAIRHVANCDDPSNLSDAELEYLDGLDTRYYAVNDRFRLVYQGYLMAWA